MAKIKIITDSTAYITKETAKDYDIGIVQLNYEMDGVSYKEGFPGTYRDYFEKLKNSNSFPKTSQPSAGDMIKIYEDILKEYDEIIVLILSSKLSGSFNSASLAANMLETDRITVIDSLSTVANLKDMVLLAADLAKNGADRNVIKEEILKYRENVGISFTVETLDYLQKGGRLSATKAKLGNVLKLKPVLKMEDGELVLAKTVRGTKRALNYMINLIPKESKKVSVVYVVENEDVEKYAQMVREHCPNAEVDIAEIGPIIGSHIGPNAFGFCYYY